MRTMTLSKLLIGSLLSLSFFRFSFYGTLFLLEIFLLIVVFHSLLFRKRDENLDSEPLGSPESNSFRKKVTHYLLLLAIISIIGGVFRGATFTDQIKGSALVFFTLINYLGLRNLTKLRADLVTTAFIGFALSGFIGFVVQPNEYARTEVWKFGFSYGLTYLIVIFLMLQNRFRRKPYQYILISYGFLALFLGTRSLGLCIILTGSFLLIGSRKIESRDRVVETPNFIKTLGALTLISILALATSSIYGIAAKQGFLGEESREQYIQQGTGDYGPIIGGRTEPIIALFAVSQSPIFGHGYGADSEIEMYEKANKFFQKHNYRVNIQLIQSRNEGRIPQHSYILNYWISYGIVGLFFWIFIFRALLRAAIKDIWSSSGTSPLILYVTILTSWNMLFSPFGAIVRLEFALILVLVESIFANRKIGFTL
jgi:O-antigen ligase